jgi:hypothetical protein
LMNSPDSTSIFESPPQSGQFHFGMSYFSGE